MTWSSSLSVRRVVMAVGIVSLLGAGSNLRAYPALGQDPAAQKPPEQQDQLKFTFDGPMILFYTIKPERTTDFEALWAGIRAGLAKSENADLKAFADTLLLYKVKSEAPAGQPAQPVVYVFRLDPPSKTFTYNPVKLLYDNVDTTDDKGAVVKKCFTRAEADELYKKFDGSFTGIQPLPLVKVGG